MSWEVREGDCVEAMAAMESESVDAVVCDPPYFLGFMGKSWDTATPGDLQHGHDRWATQALRVLRPGGHLLAFGGTRTFHRLACALEDAGFEIRDCLSWMYGSGFPKSLDVGKALDKAAGVEREVVGVDRRKWRDDTNHANASYEGSLRTPVNYDVKAQITAPATPEAQQWNGWGTALKPSWEPIVLARKPLTGTVAQNVLEHGTGALNIGGTRIGTGDNLNGGRYSGHGEGEADGNAYGSGINQRTPGGYEQPSGRWPANTLLSHSDECVRVGTRRVRSHNPDNKTTDEGATAGVYGEYSRRSSVGHAQDGLETVEDWECVEDCPVRLLDEQSGERPGQHRQRRDTAIPSNYFGAHKESDVGEAYGDSGGASRFFYTAKSSRAERNAGLEGFEEGGNGSLGVSRTGDTRVGRVRSDGAIQRQSTPRPAANVHPTVKPIALMRWLCRLVTPPGGLICDPFAGSGTTGIAASLEGFDFIGIERESEYVAIARARIAFWDEHGEQALEQVQIQERAETERAEVAAAGQAELF